MAEPKIYVGRGQTRTFDDGGHEHAIRITLSKIPEEHTWTSDKGNKFVKLKIRTLREPDKDGNDNTVFVDTWKPDKSHAESAPTPRPTETEAEQGGDYARPPF